MAAKQVLTSSLSPIRYPVQENYAKIPLPTVGKFFKYQETAE